MGALPYPDVGLSRVFWVETDECSAGGSGTCSGSRAACPCAPCPATSPRSAAGSAPRSGLGAVPPLRGALRAGLQLHRPLLRQREGVRGEPGGRDQEEPLRAGALVLRREGLQREAPGGVPGGVAGKGPLPEGKTRARVPRGRPRGALAAAVGALRVRDVDRAQVRLAGLVQWRRRAPVLGGPGDSLPRGRRRDGRLRRRGRRARRRGLGAPRARVGRRAHRLGRPAPAAGAAARPPGRAARQRGGEVAAGRASPSSTQRSRQTCAPTCARPATPRRGAAGGGRGGGGLLPRGRRRRRRRHPASSPRARRCSPASWSRGSARSGQDCSGGQGFPCPRPARASIGPTSGSRRAGVARRYSRSTSSGGRRTWSSTALPAAARPT